MLQTILGRSKEPYYQYEPYLNRSDGQPGWQWKFISCAGEKNIKGRIACGANRIGKTEQGAYEAVLAVTGQHPTRTFPAQGLGWIVGLDANMVNQIDRPMFEKFLPARYKTKFHRQQNIWTCKADGREWTIVFKSCEMGADKFQGAKVDFVWIDEEPRNTDLFKEMEARLIDRRGIWWMTATPVRGTAWLKQTMERPDVAYTFAGMRENPYLPIEEVEAFAAGLDEDERAVRVDGRYIIFGGRPVFVRQKMQAMLDKAGTWRKEHGFLREAI